MSSEWSYSGLCLRLPSGKWDFSKGIMINTQPLVLSFMLSSPASNLLMLSGALMCLCESQWWGIKITSLWVSAFCVLGVTVAVQHHYTSTAQTCYRFFKWIFKMPNNWNKKTANQNRASCSKAVSRVWRLLWKSWLQFLTLSAFAQSTRWSSFFWILNFVLTAFLHAL